jgi:hypothetical protein
MSFDYIYTRSLIGGFYNTDPISVSGVKSVLENSVEAAIPNKRFLMFCADTEVKFSFDDELTSEEQTILTSSISTHQNGTRWNEKCYKLYEYIVGEHNSTVCPKTIDYGTQLTIRVHPKNTFSTGVLTKIIYYASYNGTTYSLPVVEENYVYTYGAGNLASSRVLTIKWYYDDGTISTDVKTMTKYYASYEAIVESNRRRQNIIDALQLDIVGLIMQTNQVSQSSAMVTGSTFLDAYSAEVRSWLITPTLYALQNRLNAEVSGSTDFQWLFNAIGGGATIRSYLLSKINY